MTKTPMRVWYSSTYRVEGLVQQMRLAEAAKRIGRLHGVVMATPAPVTLAQLDGLHEPGYLRAFLDGTEPLASSQGMAWSAALRDATLAMLGGQLAAADSAMRDGVALNLARGFHHAVPARGTGFCAINGLALVAFAHPDKRVLVLDCDEHGGNGTEEFSDRLDNLYCFSIFGTRFGCLGGAHSRAVHVRAGPDMARDYADALVKAQRYMNHVRPDLLIYQAGVDCHRKDPKASLKLATGSLFRRDLAVFSMACDAGIPVLFCVGGGYQDARVVARLNTNTVRAALLANGLR